MKILFTTNGTEYSQKVAEFTAYLFHSIKPHITVIHVHPTPARESITKAKKYLNIAEEIFKKHDFPVSKILLEGSIAEEIIKESQKGEYHLLVLGPKGHSSVLVQVTTSLLTESEESILKKSPISLLIVRNPRPNIDYVLACTDGGHDAEAALDFWGRLKKEYTPKVTLYNILSNPFVRFGNELGHWKKELLDIYAKSSTSPMIAIANRGKEILEKYGVTNVEVKVREGEYAAKKILKEAKKGHYDLILVGYRGLSKPKNIGGQSLAVAQFASTSVLIYLPQKMK